MRRDISKNVSSSSQRKDKTMNEKPMEKEQEQPIVEKKAYTPPTLTVYGKLTELTAGGSGQAHEAGNPHEPKLRP
jgi:hypothetical protein